MAQQYPYGGQPPAYPYSQDQYGLSQPQLYPPQQGGSRPARPYQQPAQPYPGQDYPQRAPSPSYQQPPQGSSPYQQPPPQQAYPPQGYPPPQYPQGPYPPPQGYPPQPYQSQSYAPQAQQGYQYGQAPSSHPPQQQQPGQAYTLLFQPTSQKHTHSLTPQSSSSPLYLINYNRFLIASTRPEISITSPAGQQVATAQWHTWSDKIDLIFTSQGCQITYKDNFEPTVGSVGRLFWTLTHGNSKEANIKCVDRTGATVVTIVLHDKLRSGKIEFWKQGLERYAFEQIVVSAVAEIEDCRRKMESANTVNPGVYAGIAVAAGN